MSGHSTGGASSVVWAFFRCGLLILAPAFWMAASFPGCEGDSSSIPADWDFKDNVPNRIVCFGDSLTALVVPPDSGPNYPQQLSYMLGNTWQVIGVGTTQQRATVAAPGVKGLIAARRPGVLMIMYGYNDFDAQTSAETLAATLLGMADDARALGTYPIVALLPVCGKTYTWMNPHIQRLNDLLRAQAVGRCGLADVAGEFGDWQEYLQPDGAHFSPEGARLAAIAFLDAL